MKHVAKSLDHRFEGGYETGPASNLRGWNCSEMMFSIVASNTRPVTDKVEKHHYEILYDRYLSHHCNERVKLLEIGFGCGMPYGAGVSSTIWPLMFPEGQVWFAEYDKDCIDKFWNEHLPWMYVTGDQANVNDLEKWVQITGGQFDFIIDDGGHTNPQVWNSFQFLWQHGLKAGGTYFIEDLHNVRVGEWYGGGVPGSRKTMVDVLQEYLGRLITTGEISSHKRRKYVSPNYHFPFVKDIQRVDCVKHMCAITKSPS